MYDIIIVGAGVGGMSSAIYARSRGKKVLLIEKESTIGGTIKNVSTITHYAGVELGKTGAEVAENAYNQLKDLGIELIQEDVKSADLKGDIKEVITNKSSYKSKVVIIASGTTQNDLPNINLSNFKYPVGVHNAFKNIEQYKNKDVAVVGGSDGAAKEALYLSDKVNKVYMLIIEEELACIDQFKSKINKCSNIEVIKNSSLINIDDYESLKSITVKNNSTNKESNIPLLNGQVFVYIGSHPNAEWCKDLEKENGFIKTNEQMETNIPGVFAIGDVRVKTIRQISTAVSDGTIAGIKASMLI